MTRGMCSPGAVVSSVTPASSLDLDPVREIPVWSLCFHFCCLQPWGSQHSLEHPCRQRGCRLGCRGGWEDETGQSELGQSWWSEGQLWGWILSTNARCKATVTHSRLVEEGRNRLCASPELSLLLPRHSAESLQGNVLSKMSREVLHLFYSPLL